MKKLTGLLVRQQPQPITGDGGAAEQLARLTNVDRQQCERAIRNWLLAGYKCEPDPETKLRPFAFRLHQFISRGDTVFASLEDDANRIHSLNGQQFAPGDPQKALLPLCFCRECGAAYYSVWKADRKGDIKFLPRDLYDRIDDPDIGEAGFSFSRSRKPVAR